jgi:hypothetical protein
VIWRRVWLIAVLGAATAGVAQPAPGPAADEPAKVRLNWPARFTPDPAAKVPGAIRPLPEVTRLVPVRTSARTFLKPAGEDLADVLMVVGTGGTQRPIFEGDGSLIFRPIRPIVRPEEPGPAPAEADGAVEYFVYISGQATGAEPPALKVQRTWFGLYAPRGERVRGLALLMPGMLGTPEPIIDLYAGALQKQGWGVVRMMAQPSRFTERVVFRIDAAEIGGSAARIAGELDDRVAECAFACQAAMAHAEGRVPGAAGLPRIAVGMSAGAMTLPTIVAREPEKYAAAVLIAGGCDYYMINEESSYRFLIGAMESRWVPQQPDDGQRKALDDAYLERAALDSYRTAAVLKGKPLLMIHGALDIGVPARLGDLLWERLGKPERWVQNAGHEEVFMKLPSQVDQIMEWLAAKTRRPDQPTDKP